MDKIIYWIYRQASTGLMLPEQLDELEFDEFKKTIIKMIEGLTLEVPGFSSHFVLHRISAANPYRFPRSIAA